MPAAAVIPAPIVYIKVVAVKKLVVGTWRAGGGAPYCGAHCPVCPLLFSADDRPGCSSPSVPARGRQVYFEKIRVLQAGSTRLNSSCME